MPETGQDQSTPDAPETPRAFMRGRTAIVLGLMLAALGAVLILSVWTALAITRWPWWVPLAAAGNLVHLFTGSWEFPTRTAAGLGAGGAVGIAVFGLGYLWLGRWRPWRRMLPLALERMALAPVAGAVPLSLTVLALGLAGGATPQALGILLAGALALASLGWLDFWREMRRGGWATLRRFVAAQPRLILFLLACVFLLALPYALSPSVESDELRYHLAAPAMWLREGRIHYVPYQAFFNFPMLGEMLFLLAMPWGGEEAAKLIHLGFLPVTAALVTLLARRMMGRAKGDKAARRHWTGLAGAAFILIPTVPILAGWGFIDMFMDAMFLAFVYLAGRALARPRRAAGGLIGLAAAGAIATKYSMVPLVGALGAVWFLMMLARERHKRRVVRLAAMAAIVAILLGGLWYVKNYTWTGNPFYPLAWSRFGGGEWSAENASFYMAKAHEKGMHLSRPGGATGKVIEFFITPVTTAFFFNKFEDHLIGPTPLMAIILLWGWLLAGRPLQALKKNGTGGSSGFASEATHGEAFQVSFFKWCIISLVGSWAFWFVTYQSNRLLLPTIGLVLAAGAVAGWRWEQAAPAWAGRLMRGIIALGALFSFLFTFTNLCLPAPRPRAGSPQPPPATKMDAIRTSLGFERREVYLSRAVNYWRAAQWLARRAQPGERVWLVGEHRTMHFPMPVIASDWFDTPQPLALIRQTADNDALLDSLLKQEIHYIFFNWAELSRYWRYFQDRFHDKEFQRFIQLGLLPAEAYGQLAQFGLVPNQPAPTNPRLEKTPFDQNGIIIYRIGPHR